MIRAGVRLPYRYSSCLNLLYQNRNYRLLYIGQFISFAGTMITNVALPYQIYQETRSSILVGLLSFFQLLPLIITALVGGALADRHHRRSLLLISESLLALGSASLALSVFFVHQNIWIIFIIAIGMSTINSLHRPALSSITQQLVAKEHFSDVGILSAYMCSLCMIIGPAVAGLLIASIGIIYPMQISFRFLHTKDLEIFSQQCA